MAYIKGWDPYEDEVAQNTRYPTVPGVPAGATTTTVTPTNTSAPTGAQTHWPDASYGSDPSGAINNQNITGNPDLPFVQAGTTGGYLDGVGETLGAGTSLTAAQRDANLSSAQAAGIPQDWINSFLADNPGDYARLESAYNSNGEGGSSDSQRSGQALPGGLNVNGIFDDPLLQQFLNVGQGYLDQLRQALPDDQFNQLMQFINGQFTDLSQNPGYSPQELAMLNTQVFEPLEAARTASQRRELDRIGRAGYLPTSGVAIERQGDIDRYYDAARTAANRDLGVQAIDERNADLGRALSLATQGYQTPLNFQGAQDARHAQAMSVAKLLADTPLEQAAFANALINGTPLNAGLNSYAQMQQLALQQQQYQDANNAAFYQWLGSMIPQFLNG